MVDAGVRHRESSCQHPEKGFSSVDATAGDRVMQRRRPRWSNVGGPAWRGRPSLQGLCGAHSGGRDPGGKVFPASLFLILFQLKMKVRSCFCCWSQQSFLCPKPSLSAVWDDGFVLPCFTNQTCCSLKDFFFSCAHHLKDSTEAGLGPNPDYGDSAHQHLSIWLVSVSSAEQLSHFQSSQINPISKHQLFFVFILYTERTNTMIQKLNWVLRIVRNYFQHAFHWCRCIIDAV